MESALREVEGLRRRLDDAEPGRGARPAKDEYCKGVEDERDFYREKVTELKNMCRCGLRRTRAGEELRRKERGESEARRRLEEVEVRLESALCEVEGLRRRLDDAEPGRGSRPDKDEYCKGVEDERDFYREKVTELKNRCSCGLREETV